MKWYKLKITKSGRQYGYIIWNKKTEPDMKRFLGENKNIPVRFNEIYLGLCPIDWRFHRLSIGYRITRGIGEEQSYYLIRLDNGVLEVTTSE